MSKPSKKGTMGKGESSYTSKAPTSGKNQTDEEIARRLDEEINGHALDNDHEHQSRNRPNFPEEIKTAVDFIQRYTDDVLGTTCHECNRPLIRQLHAQDWIKRWKKTDMKSASGCRCKCGAITCVGCGDEALQGNPKYMAEYEGLKLDYCCSKGAVFIAWIVLCQYDDMELNLQARSEHKQATMKQVQGLAHRGPAHRGLVANGIGYGRDIRTSPFQYDIIHSATAADEGYRRPGLQRALHFNQVDSETDGLTRWILGMLIELLPRRKETSKKVNPLMGSMIELSLLQDRVAELLRNDSLQDVDKRPDLYFATFEFVHRLGAHPKLEYLARGERFVKKQSAGLQIIATASGIRKGKQTAQSVLTVATRSEGMAPSLLSCLANLNTQSKVLLGGTNNTAAGKNVLEVAKRVDKLYTQLVGDTEKISTITTWKEYHRERCLVRQANVARYLCLGMSKLASQVHNPATGRMKRLVTEASEMITSLPEGIFVRVDEDRPDIIKALIIGPEDTPYQGGLFEFDIVCGRDYPFLPPSVWFLTTGQGTVGFNPNLYATGKVCLSLIGTWPGGPETKWQPGRSTIASILVSIQSMILWQWPYENEPGHENGHNDPRIRPHCLGYNKMIRNYTLRHAILEWLMRKEMREGLWRDVLKDYFRFCGKKVVENARRWEKDDAPGGPVAKGGILTMGKGVLGKVGRLGRTVADELEMEIEKIRSEKV
ncbi:MAG: hypothetical protein Q9211_006099 [Gyalolechia sp. 1 TL-2023]